VPISRFLWPEDRIEHIAQHGVTPEQFEEVCFGVSLVLRARGENPVYYVLGETDACRPLFCVVIEFPWRQGYPVTARDMTTQEKRRYADVLLTAAEHETIRREAAARGLNEAALIQEWVRERLGRT
jgi:uncharacterized DUF497 family protein